MVNEARWRCRWRRRSPYLILGVAHTDLWMVRGLGETYWCGEEEEGGCGVGLMQGGNSKSISNLKHAGTVQVRNTYLKPFDRNMELWLSIGAARIWR